MSIVEDVREAVLEIPPGSVASYGDIGKRIGAGPRQVGRAMSLLDDDGLPWWRVVYADGTPSSCHGGRALPLLSDERTPMTGARVDMQRARHGRSTPDDAPAVASSPPPGGDGAGSRGCPRG